MAALYVTDITRSVLTGPTLPFLGVLLRVSYSLSICDPGLRDCIATLSRQFLPLPASNGDRLPIMLGLSQRTHLSVDHF
jgi:hypothetical protein